MENINSTISSTSKRLRSASVFFLLNENKEFILQHKDIDSPRLANHWAFFGGGVEAEESPIEAVEREAMEELQISLEDLKQIGTYDDDYYDEHVIFHVYTATLKNTISQLKAQQMEGDDLGLYNYDMTKSLLMHPSNQKILKDLHSRKIIS